MMRKWLAGLFAAMYLIVGAVAAAQPKIPPAPASSIYIQDYAGVVKDDIKPKINSLGARLATATKAQVVVVTVKSLDGVPIEEYALTLLREWGIGDKKLNNGVLILVAVNDRQSRIEVGYGLEGILPDAKTGRIQDEFMISYFAQGDFSRGIYNGYKAVISEVAKEYNADIKLDSKPVGKIKNEKPAGPSWWDGLPWWTQVAVGAGVLGLLAVDWLFFGGTFTFLILALFRGRGGSGGGYGGGSGGGGGSSRKW